VKWEEWMARVCKPLPMANVESFDDVDAAAASLTEA